MVDIDVIDKKKRMNATGRKGKVKLVICQQWRGKYGYAHRESLQVVVVFGLYKCMYMMMILDNDRDGDIIEYT